MKSEIKQNQLAQLTESIEKECAVAKHWNWRRNCMERILFTETTGQNCLRAI
jgi:hypothetical protein